MAQTLRLNGLLTCALFGLLVVGSAQGCGSPASSSAPGVGTKQGIGFEHYVNKNPGYSLDYPKGWIIEQIAPGEMGFKPKDSKFSQIQVAAFTGPAGLHSLSPSMVTAAVKADVKQFLTLLGATDIDVFSSEAAPAGSKWDFITSFNFTYDKEPLRGFVLSLETSSATYGLTVISEWGGDWAEGADVVNSFNPIP